MTETDSTARLLREAVAALDGAAEQPSDQLTEEAATALRAVVRLRDALLATLRAQPEANHAQSQAMLEVANRALSLVSGVAYPAGKIERAGLRQARDALAGLVDVRRA